MVEKPPRTLRSKLEPYYFAILFYASLIFVIGVIVILVLVYTNHYTRLQPYKNVLQFMVAANMENFERARIDKATALYHEDTSEYVGEINMLLDWWELRAKTGNLIDGSKYNKKLKEEEQIAVEFWKGVEALREEMELSVPNADGTWPTLEQVQHASDVSNRFDESMERLSKLFLAYKSAHPNPGFDTAKFMEKEEVGYRNYIDDYGHRFDLNGFDQWYQNNNP